MRNFGLAKHHPEPTFNPEVSAPHNNYPYLEAEPDPHQDANVAWAKVILLGLGLACGFGALVSAAILIWLGSMVIPWP